ncbi:hypothetical protein [Acidisphaera sp. S103]|uniref:hypothetical protein n=1 Tax=Acidisphaera sp. S103 TaxID=1747223 RepID=UPI00131C4739|nr:hypothetical protein [Acidisphaera sp. S103]
MSDKRSDIAILDRAYGDGKLAGFWGLETSAACPFGSDQTGPRIAWLDGFAYGAWQGGARSSDSGQGGECDGARLAAYDRPDHEIVDVAVAHLLRLSKAIGPGTDQCLELDSALQAATVFIRSVRRTRAARQDPPELLKRQTRAQRYSQTHR